jgi:[ribosomal protein S5]-alanine N-acetyltransferase
MILHTPRLMIRDFVYEDWKAVHRYASNKEVAKFMVWGPNSEEQSRAFIGRALSMQKQAPRVNYELGLALTENGMLIGGCGIHIENADNAEIGYCLHPEYWGMGYASEAARAILEFGFTELGVHRIFATCHPDNSNSYNVMKRIGMKQEGHLREHIRYKGKWRDSLLFSILVSEWRDGAPAES